MAGCQIHSAYTGIAGSHISGFNSHGIVAIRGQEVAQFDVDRVIDAAKAVAIPADQKILHILPQEFVIDNQDCIHEPIGMSGVRLEAKVHIVTGAVSAAQNIVKCVERCGIEVSDVILEQLASSYAVLTDDEKELGVCVVDMGSGTMDISVFLGGALRHSSVLEYAGKSVTNDIAIAFSAPPTSAEEVKIKYGCLICDNMPTDAMIELPSVGGRPAQRLQQQEFLGLRRVLQQHPRTGRRRHRPAGACADRYQLADPAPPGAVPGRLSLLIPRDRAGDTSLRPTSFLR